jgi:hypothetical protein
MGSEVEARTTLLEGSFAQAGLSVLRRVAYTVFAVPFSIYSSVGLRRRHWHKSQNRHAYPFKSI